MAIRPQTRRARHLRRSMTDAEQKLWKSFREIGLPYKVRRQHPIGNYVVDFAIPARRLVIEVDGGQHAMGTEKDALRTKVLNERGYRVIRFWNNEILGNLDGVLQTIGAELEA